MALPARPRTRFGTGWYPRKNRVTLLGGRPSVEGDIVATSEYIRTKTEYTDVPVSTDEIEPSIDAGASRLCLVACNGCPWAHRTMLCRDLLGLEKAIVLVPTDDWNPVPSLITMPLPVPAISTSGWRMRADKIPPQMLASLSPALRERVVVTGYLWLWELYVDQDPSATGRVTVPVIWDCETKKIINNESSSILRILNRNLRPLCKPGAPDLTPPAYALADIDSTNDLIYNVNNGVYRCGFGPTPEARAVAKREVYTALDEIEARVLRQPYVMGDSLTECDVKLYASLIRFEFGYYLMFRIDDKPRLRYAYPHTFAYLQRLYAIDAFRRRSYPGWFGLFYSIITRWDGRAIGNLARLAQLMTFCSLQATAPDCPPWRWQLAEALSVPFSLLSRAVATP